MQLFNIIGLTLLIVTFVSPPAYSNERSTSTVIRHMEQSGEGDPQNSFYIKILDEICTVTKSIYGSCELSPISLPMLQDRQLKSLEKNLIDVVWTVSTPARESRVRAIKFPLLKGFLGFRIAVYNSTVKETFTPKTPLSAIKQLTVIQGHDWPDSNILKSNQFNVHTTSKLESLYSDISKGLYDYTLRGMFEAHNEFQSTIEKNLKLDQNHAFIYPSSIYFFVNKDNEYLAKRIEYGLQKLELSGKYLKILTEHPIHSKSISALNLRERQIHFLERNGIRMTEKQVNEMLDLLD